MNVRTAQTQTSQDPEFSVCPKKKEKKEAASFLWVRGCCFRCCVSNNERRVVVAACVCVCVCVT